MITLNLLDATRKKNYLRHRILMTVQKSIEIFFFFILIIGIIFSLAQRYLQKNFETITEQITYINKNLSSFNQEINQINYQLKEIEKIQKEYLAWSPVLIEINNAVPAEVKLNILNINKDKTLIQMSGLAKDRDKFLALKSNLENIYFVKEVQSPLTNLLKKDNVDFQFTISIDLNRFSYD
jgi:Tfp pilus assembly protein PilN